MENQPINASANAATKRCPYCGEMVPVNSQKCRHCGEWLVVRYGKSWVKTYLLCGFLGIFGAHNFYNNKTGIAVAQLILSLTIIGLFISIPWVIIDCIMILCDNYVDNEGRKLDRKPTKDRTAALCALGFLGCAGLHRFYTKHVALGFLMSFTYGGLFIWTIIDFIMILTGNFKDAEGNLIKG